MAHSRWLRGQIQPNRGSLEKWWACTHKSLGAFPSLLMPTNKSYFTIKKKKKNSLAFSDLAYGGGRVGWTWVYKVKLYIIIKLTNYQHRERQKEQGLGRVGEEEKLGLPF